MQYDENAEKYGYEGEMTPLKCDELKAYIAPTPDGTGLADYYLKSEADKVIADLEESHKMEVEQLLMKIAGLEKLVETADKLLKQKGGFMINDITFDGVKLEGFKKEA